MILALDVAIHANGIILLVGAVREKSEQTFHRQGQRLGEVASVVWDVEEHMEESLILVMLGKGRDFLRLVMSHGVPFDEKKGADAPFFGYLDAVAFPGPEITFVNCRAGVEQNPYHLSEVVACCAIQGR